MNNEFESVKSAAKSDDPVNAGSHESNGEMSIDRSVPIADQVYQYLTFGLSLPERTLRSTAAMVGGAVNESAGLLVPQAFQDSKTYQTFVRQMIDFMANDVGGVKKTVDADAGETNDVENYVAQKAVSTFVDLAGMATLHVSPLTILAIVSDLAYGSKAYLDELTDELKREGVINESSVIRNTADLLDAVGAASAHSVDVLDTPPLSVAGLQETIEQTTARIANIDPKRLIPESEIAQIWGDMQMMAAKENVNIFEISSAMTLYTLGHVNTVSQGALSTIRVTGNVIDREIFEHYRQSLDQIRDRGIYHLLAESSQPYVDAVWFNFSSDRPTLTEDLISGKMADKAWLGLKGLFRGKIDAE